MTFFSFCAKVALIVSCAIVIAAVLLLLMASVCLGLGAYESITNPAAAHESQVEYQNATTQIGAGVAGLNRAVSNVTGG